MRRAKLLPGLATATKRLADGTRRTYYYAWRGGPLLPGQPGTPDFLPAYTRAHETRKKPASDTMLSLIAAFKASSEFTKKAERTKKDYMQFLKLIEDEFGDMPLSLVEKPRARGRFKKWRDGMARTPRTADYAWGVLARVLSVAKDHGKIATNVCERGGRLYSVDRAEIIWREEHIAAFNAVASAPLRFALQLALWTAQRQGDLVKLTWSQYDGTYIRIRQGKTKARVVVPVAGALKDALDSARRSEGPILRSTYGRPWTPEGFRASWGTAARRAGLKNLRFHDLRGTAVTKLSLAGCNNQQIAAITGHSTKEVDRIIGAYRGGRQELADQGMVLLQTALQTALSDLPNPLANPLI